MVPWPNRIRAIRKTRGLTQAQLAEMIGKSRRSVIDWEAGRYEPERVAQCALIAAETGLL